MPEPTHQTLAAERSGPDLYLTTRFPLETPLSVAEQKAAQLHALLRLLCEQAPGDGGPDAGDDCAQHSALSLAAELAHQTLVFSEMALRHAPETAGIG